MQVVVVLMLIISLIGHVVISSNIQKEERLIKLGKLLVKHWDREKKIIRDEGKDKINNLIGEFFDEL